MCLVAEKMEGGVRVRLELVKKKEKEKKIGKKESARKMLGTNVLCSKIYIPIFFSLYFQTKQGVDLIYPCLLPPEFLIFWFYVVSRKNSSTGYFV